MKDYFYGGIAWDNVFDYYTDGKKIEEKDNVMFNYLSEYDKQTDNDNRRRQFLFKLGYDDIAKLLTRYSSNIESAMSYFDDPLDPDRDIDSIEFIDHLLGFTGHILHITYPQLWSEKKERTFADVFEVVNKNPISANILNAAKKYYFSKKYPGPEEYISAIEKLGNDKERIELYKRIHIQLSWFFGPNGYPFQTNIAEFLADRKKWEFKTEKKEERIKTTHEPVFVETVSYKGNGVPKLVPSSPPNESKTTVKPILISPKIYYDIVTDQNFIDNLDAVQGGWYRNTEQTRLKLVNKIYSHDLLPILKPYDSNGEFQKALSSLKKTQK